jgi:hypothetical protein
MTNLEIFLLIFDILLFVLGFWWLYLPIFLFHFLKEFYLDAVSTAYIENSGWEWVNLEVSLQQATEKTPKAMELVLTAMHGIQKNVSFWEEYLDGVVPPWYSFEIVGIDGNVHFIIRTLRDYQNLVEKAVYAQYPDVELTEVEDYVGKLDRSGLEIDYNVFGTDFELVKKDAYPIKTYQDYLDPDAPGLLLDPISQIAELLAGLKIGEQIWIQFAARPADDSWSKASQAEIDKILGKTPAVEVGIVDKVFGTILQVLTVGIIQAPQSKPAGTGDDGAPAVQRLSPGQTEALKAIERNQTKPAYATTVRWMYIAKNDAFRGSMIASMMGAFKVFNDTNLNGFKPNRNVITSVKKMFDRKDKDAERYRKNFLLDLYKKRKVGPSKYNLNVEELATLFHFPGEAVTTSMLKRIQSKKPSPPSQLPVIE